MGSKLVASRAIAAVSVPPITGLLAAGAVVAAAAGAVVGRPAGVVASGVAWDGPHATSSANALGLRTKIFRRFIWELLFSVAGLAGSGQSFLVAGEYANITPRVAVMKYQRGIRGSRCARSYVTPGWLLH